MKSYTIQVERDLKDLLIVKGGSNVDGLDWIGLD